MFGVMLIFVYVLYVCISMNRRAKQMSEELESQQFEGSRQELAVEDKLCP
jgi:hypothetical protein